MPFQPSQSRLLNALAAICALTLTAGVLFVFAHPATVAARAGRQVSVAPAPHPTTLTSAPAATPSTTTTTATPATVAPSTTSTAPATTRAPSTTTAAPDPNRRWAVGTQTYTFVDTSRTTPPAGADPGEPSRTLPTVIRYPVDAPASGAEVAGGAGSHLGPFPLIVFAHGFDSSPSVYAALLHAWASAGYVVAAPSFPRATAGGPLDESDVDNQPGDLSVVITRVLALAGAGGPLAGLVDGAHVGVAGHSDGASTTAGIGYNTCCRDSRVLADAVMEGDEHAFPGGSWFPAGAAPALLVIQGDHDVLNPPALGEAVYHGGRSPKYLLWLVNADHLPPYTSDAPHLEVVEAVTTAFFDRYLKGRGSAVGQMRQAATPALATLTAG